LSAALAAEVRLDELLTHCRTDPFELSKISGRSGYNLRSWTAELTRVAGRSDPAAWDFAAVGWAELGTPHRVAYCRYRQAEALLTDPRGRGVAAPLLREAARLAVEHVPLTAAIDELADRAHLTFGPVPAQAHTSRPARLAALTDRELAVLREIALGRTNTQIGAELYISAKTASVHVSNILRKLNVGSRVQAAALAAQLGLLDPVDHG
jgi:DNA-binding CsgD family transcriptional regulator